MDPQTQTSQTTTDADHAQDAAPEQAPDANATGADRQSAPDPESANGQTPGARGEEPTTEASSGPPSDPTPGAEDSAAPPPIRPDQPTPTSSETTTPAADTGPAAPAEAPQPAPTPPPPAESQPAKPSLNAEIEREIDEAMAAMEAEDELAAPAPPPAAPAPAGTSSIRGPRVIQAGREHRTGRVVSVGPSDIFVEFGPKQLGVAPRSQWPEEELPKVDESLQVVIDRFEANEQIYICSRPGAIQKAEWELLEPGQIVEARVTGANKGGLELEIAKHRAFMPASLVDTQRHDDLSTFVGEKVKCKVERIDRRGRGNIVLNRRAVVSEERREARESLKKELAEGQTKEGVVRKIMPFGAFVDLGGVDGLVHISDLSHDRVQKVEDVVKEGDAVTVRVLKVDWDKNRISLGMKQTQPDPFEQAMEAIQPEATATGKVTKTTEFGAFVELAPGVEGLVHISELDWKRVQKVEHVVKPGQTVNVKILSVDTDSRRISLSVKQTTDPPADKRGDRARSEDEIRKETPAQRRMREKAKASKKGEGLKGGFGRDMGMGLGDLKL